MHVSGNTQHRVFHTPFRFHSIRELTNRLYITWGPVLIYDVTFLNALFEAIAVAVTFDDVALMRDAI